LREKGAKVSEVGIGLGDTSARFRRYLAKVGDEAVESAPKTRPDTVLECLEVLERQSTNKDKLVDDLSCRITILSEALGKCPGREGILKILSGSGRREDPFELDDDDKESWDDCPEGSSPEARGMAHPLEQSQHLWHQQPSQWKFRAPPDCPPLVPRSEPGLQCLAEPQLPTLCAVTPSQQPIPE